MADLKTPLSQAASDLMQSITEHYLGGPDFNGYPLRLEKIPLDEIKKLLRELLNKGFLSLNFGDRHPNPYVKALAPESKAIQLKKLGALKDITHLCAYPENAWLKGRIDGRKYKGLPYAREMALGKPSLDTPFFRLEVIEKYRNDPRYTYHGGDYVGAIFADDPSLGKQQQTHLQSLGYGYDKSFNRFICAFYIDLSKLPGDEQTFWKQHEVKSDGMSAHPNFIITQVMGNWPDKASVFEAFIEELHVLNKMAIAITGKKLFRAEFRGGKRPKEFAFLIRPTSKEFNNFIELLDKMLSQNINSDFFDGLVDRENETAREDGKVTVTQKGTLQMLEEWLRAKATPREPKPMDRMFKEFRSIRGLRQKPAHSIADNKFDQSIFKKQRAQINSAYVALRTLRLILANHPAAKSVDVPEWLYKGDILTF